jgi:FMN-dependent oxidoreductase (nitrilotriacetate monooxygenase family)
VDINYYRRLAQLCEAGKFDMIFFADGLGARMDKLDISSRYPTYMNQLEPLTLAGNIAGATEHIGIGATISTSFTEPYNGARAFVSLDHISSGRAACNIVTSSSDNAAKCFGQDNLFSHADRYGRAREYLEVINKLWDSWEDDAFIRDRERGLFFDPAKQHPVDHQGKYFKVNGALNIERAPQGKPVVIQAGGSEAGKELAAETAEVVFAAGAGLEKAVAFYKDLKGRMAKYGRSPDELKILLGFPAIVGDTDAAAEALYAELQSMIHVEVGRNRLEVDLETNLSDLPLDEPIPPARIPQAAKFNTTYFNNIKDVILNERPTLRELAMRYHRDDATHCGSPKTIADIMQKWFEAGACDGFMMNFQTLPGGLEKFVDSVVPELQARELFRHEYTGRTLRDHLGLKRPRHGCM